MSHLQIYHFVLRKVNHTISNAIVIVMLLSPTRSCYEIL